LLTGSTFEWQESNLKAMAYETIDIVQPEDGRINMSDAWQVLWWCRYFSLTKSQLETTVQAVGPKVSDIEQYLAAHEIGKTAVPLPNAVGQVNVKRYLH